MGYINEYSDLSQKERRQLEYKRQYKETHPAWDDSMVLLTRLVGERVAHGADVLDVGCGHGNFVLDEMGDVFGKKIGMDAEREATVGNRSVQEIVYGDIATLPFSDGSFDLVLSLWVLEHVADPDRVFQEIVRILKPGGLFAFVTPNKNSALIRVRRLFSKQMADRILLWLYNRREEDVFDVYYRANTVRAITAVARTVGLSVEILQENADPSYTSFGPISYWVSEKLSRLDLSIVRPHVIGLLRKESISVP